MSHSAEVLTTTMGPRTSEDSQGDGSLALDSAAVDRALKRRQVLDELTDTEQSYIGDIQLLLNVG
jgi:hypothetical protein